MAARMKAPRPLHPGSSLVVIGVRFAFIEASLVSATSQLPRDHRDPASVDLALDQS
jgi:hypothetical protein